MTSRHLAVRMAPGLGVIVAMVLAENLLGRHVAELTLRLPGIDKLLHFVEYGLIFAVGQQVAAAVGLTGTRPRTTALLVGVGLAVIDEVMQAWNPSRSVEMLDLMADGCGLALAWSLAALNGVRRLIAAGAVIVVAGAIVGESYRMTHDFARGLLFERRHDFRAARVHYLEAERAGVRTAALYNSLGWVEIESGEGDAEKAVAWATTALEMRPRDPEILDTLGWALHHAGRHEEALAALDAAYRGKPNIFCIHYHLGMVHAARGRPDEAARQFRLQIERFPAADESRRARFELARVTAGGVN